jgi:hypothetical protein
LLPEELEIRARDLPVAVPEKHGLFVDHLAQRHLPAYGTSRHRTPADSAAARELDRGQCATPPARPEEVAAAGPPEPPRARSDTLTGTVGSYEEAAPMSAPESGNGSTRTTVLGRLVEAVPEQYRQEMTRFAQRIRDRLPPVMIEHRIDALERHVDSRLSEIEAKVEKMLRLLEKRSS